MTSSQSNLFIFWFVSFVAAAMAIPNQTAVNRFESWDTEIGSSQMQKFLCSKKAALDWNLLEQWANVCFQVIAPFWMDVLN